MKSADAGSGCGVAAASATDTAAAPNSTCRRLGVGDCPEACSFPEIVSCLRQKAPADAWGPRIAECSQSDVSHERA